MQRVKSPLHPLGRLDPGGLGRDTPPPAWARTIARTILRNDCPAYCPVPVSLMTAGPSGALCVTVAAPVMAPVTLGVKVTLKVHFPPAAKVALQGFVPDGVAVKSPLARMLEIVSVLPELLVSVTVFAALVVPTAWVPKARLVGESETGSTPVPLTSMTCGLPAPDVAIATLPLVEPVLI